MKSALVLTLTAMLAVASCTYKTTKVQPVAAPPARARPVVGAPRPQAVVGAAPAPQRVMVTYALPAGFPAAQVSAISYCRAHYGATSAAILSDDHAGHATFACVS